jgi:hypothetical protein
MQDPDAHELHWPGVPPAPHAVVPEHVPQSSWLPQPSSAVPHWYPRSSHVVGTHGSPHTLGCPPPPQVSGAVHVPQLITLPQPGPPQPSSAVPQLNPRDAQVCGVHSGGSQTFAMFAPQTEHGWQLPQSIGWPRPSSAAPQS